MAQKAQREKKTASAKNVSSYCVKYQEGGKKVGRTNGKERVIRKKR